MFLKNYKYIFLSFFFFFLSLNAAPHNIPFEIIKANLPQNPIILEAGAQFGEDTGWMSKLWPTGQIHAFEPSPTSFLQLNKKLKEQKNVFCYNLALSNVEGQLSFYTAGGASSLLKPTKSFNDAYFHADLNHPIKVQCTTINKWAQKHNIKKIDFLWLDMEGNELNALKGASTLLKNIKLIFTEVNFQTFWENCATYKHLKRWLALNGFRELWIDRSAPTWQGNALFINTKLEN